MTKHFSYRSSMGFDDSRQASCLALFELGEQDYALVDLLQTHVIRPNIERIVQQFYDFMLDYEEFRGFLDGKALIKRLKKTQSDYLLGLGVNFADRDYFEERLRVGMAHRRIGLPIAYYQSAYRKLQQILVDTIPEDIGSRGTSFHEMSDLIAKLGSLDMTLAIETYYVGYIRELQSSLDDLRLEGDELRDLVSIDAMTGLHNREYIIGLLERSVAKAVNNKKPLSVAMLDVDYFKKINDTYGHLAGDKVLQKIAGHIAEVVRESDCVGRYGGEEFLIVFNSTSRQTAEKVIKRVRSTIASSAIRLEDGSKLNITLSAGVTACKHTDTMTSLLERVDAALYLAKNTGRNRVVVK